MKKRKRDEQMQISPYARLVSLPVNSENIFHFPEGLPAFETVKEFVFICKPDTAPFVFMHALNPPDLAFVCIDPFLICPNYNLRLSQGDVNFLHMERPEDALILAIVTVRKDVRETSANLQGPVVINMQTCVGKQVVCEGMRFPVRYRIWDALKNLNDANPAAQQAEAEKLAKEVIVHK
ncbi:MAG: flagellar assembly protein FliW [Kiritimatiellae bacterium]|nr:flagellar assembly protein FliW [Kiritimatiellia bacterium]